MYFCHLNTDTDLGFIWIWMLGIVLFFLLFYKRDRQYNNTYIEVWVLSNICQDSNRHWDFVLKILIKIFKVYFFKRKTKWISLGTENTLLVSWSHFRFEHNVFLWTIILIVQALRAPSPHPARDPRRNISLWRPTILPHGYHSGASSPEPVPVWPWALPSQAYSQAHVPGFRLSPSSRPCLTFPGVGITLTRSNPDATQRQRSQPRLCLLALSHHHSLHPHPPPPHHHHH